MAKKNPVKKFKHQDKDEDFAFDFSEFAGSHSEDEMVTTMMESLIDASSQQTLAAIELTKIAIAKNSSQTLTEADIFATFKNASRVVQDVSPLKTLWGKLSLDQ